MDGLDRRSLVTGMSGLSLTALAGRGVAQSNRPLVVGSYAGVFDQAMREAFITDFTARTGIRVEPSIGGSSQWLGQVEANPDHPPVDVVLCSPRDALLAAKTGLYDKPSTKTLTNMADIPQPLIDVCEGWAVVFDYGAGGLAYNSDRIKNPPKTIKEFVERTIKGEWTASLPNVSQLITPSTLIWSFNDALGGTLDNITPFVTAMQKMKPNVIRWNGNPDFVTQLQSGEADIGVYVDGRTWALHFGGSPWARFLNPGEGAVIEPVAALKPKNAHPASWAFIDTMLAPGPQSQFADITYFGMSNSKTVYSDKVKDIVTRWQQGRLPPSDAIATRMPQWVERWNKDIRL